MRAKTPSFTAEFPVATTAAQNYELERRLEAARCIYNAAVGEALRRLELMKQSKAWHQARKLSDKTVRATTFKALRKKFGLVEGALQVFTKNCRHACWIKDCLGSVETQTITSRAFEAVHRYCYGTKGRPRFKGPGRINSVEGHDNKSNLVYRNGKIIWMGLELQILFDPKDKHGWQTTALTRKIKFCRVFRRKIKGEFQWYCHLVCEGKAPTKVKNATPDNTVGLDLGPTTVAIVGADHASLVPLCPSVDIPRATLKLIRRAMERSRRATNPSNFNEDKTYKPGRHKWSKSTRYKKLCVTLAEIERKLEAERYRAHGELCNEILSLGKEVKTEKISYASWQKNFGKSVQARAPGTFITLLKRKAENAGGSATEICTRTTKLSQFDHTTGDCVEKTLKQRIHVFRDGVTEPVQRDLYSAFLAKHCSKDRLDVRQAVEAWPAAEPLLRHATSEWKKSAKEKDYVNLNGENRQSRSPVKEERNHDEAKDVVVEDSSTRALENCGGCLKTSELKL